MRTKPSTIFTLIGLTISVIESVKQEGKRGGTGSSSLKLNLIYPCRAWGMLGRQAGATVSVYARVQCREPKTGQQKVQFYCEDEIHCRSGYSLSMISVHSLNMQFSYNLQFPLNIFSTRCLCKVYLFFLISALLLLHSTNTRIKNYSEHWFSNRLTVSYSV